MDSKQKLNAFIEEYLNPTPDRRFDQKVIKLVSDYVIPRLEGQNLLELGVGDQIWTPKLLERFRHVTTIDGSDLLLSEMKKKINDKNWKPVVSLFEDYQPKHRFDAVIATYVLEHVDNPFKILELAKKKWLKHNGQITIVVPHALSLHRRLAVKMGLIPYCGELGELDRRVGHKHCFSCYEMEKLLINAGFKILEKKGMFTKVLTNSMLIQCSDEQLTGMFELGLELPIEYSAIIYFLAKAI